MMRMALRPCLVIPSLPYHVPVRRERGQGEGSARFSESSDAPSQPPQTRHAPAPHSSPVQGDKACAWVTRCVPRSAVDDREDEQQRKRAADDPCEWPVDGYGFCIPQFMPQADNCAG